MKIIFSILSVFLVFGLFSAKAQFKEGNIELGFSGTFGTFNEKYSYSSSYGSNTTSIDRTYFFVSLLPSYYFADGFSIEPEFGLVSMQKVKPGVIILGNLSYSYFLKNDNFALFARAGYGRSNSIFFPGAITPGSSGSNLDLDINVWNLGGGFKFLIGSKALIRTEINYRNFSYEKNESPNYSSNEKVNFISVLFGVGIIL